MGQFITALIVVGVLAGAVGAISAMRDAPARPDHSAKETGAEDKGGDANILPASNLLDLPPVVTNIGSPQETWVRLEASMIFDPKAVPQPDALGAEIAADVLAYMRTVSLAQIQGPIGLQNLREDLNERASVRSGGKVKELVLRTLVLQ